MTVLHPDNKIRYNEGDKVQIALHGDANNIIQGVIVGLASEHIIDHWMVKLDKPLENWQYSCINVQHTFIRPLGDNRPFLCEGFSRV